MTKPRSPALGYNHNVRHAERLWHVQTEDSGVQHPHIFTHLFHAGTIFASKRTDYDPQLAVEDVQKLMQKQHKEMLQDLRSGAFDDKITKFFGASKTSDKAPAHHAEFDDSPSTVTDIRPEELPTDTQRMPAPQFPTARDTVAMPAAQISEMIQAAIEAAAQNPPKAGVPSVNELRPRKGAEQQGQTRTQAAASAKAAPPPAKAPQPQAGKPAPVLVPSAPKVTVSATASKKAPARDAVMTRPAVIVGEPAAKKAPRANMFGGDKASSEKSLDEVILAYLSEDKDK